MRVYGFFECTIYLEEDLLYNNKSLSAFYKSNDYFLIKFLKFRKKDTNYHFVNLIVFQSKFSIVRNKIIGMLK